MADRSIVPLGAGVSISTGLKTDLGVLIDGNQATYEIASGTDMHLLYIQAKRIETGMDSGWVFSLESKKLEDVAKIYKPASEGGDNFGPHWVDDKGYPVAMDLSSNSYTPPSMPPRELGPGGMTTVVKSTFPDSFEGIGVLGGSFISPIELEYDPNELSANFITEVGVHIYPIAYHRVNTESDPPTAMIMQVARSDWHFWPMPTIPVWSHAPKIYRLGAASCTPSTGTPTTPTTPTPPPP